MGASRSVYLYMLTPEYYQQCPNHAAPIYFFASKKNLNKMGFEQNMMISPPSIPCNVMMPPSSYS